MGEDKALLKLRGVPLIELVLHEIEDLTDEILITTNNPKSLEYLHVRLVTDPMPGEAPYEVCIPPWHPPTMNACL